MQTKPKFMLVPCSGIGKALGTIGREVIFKVTKELRPHEAETLCLPLLVKGEAKAVKKVRTQPVITLDGCPKMCAQKCVLAQDGNIIKELKVMDILKEHKNLKPGTVTDIGSDGWKLVDIISGQIVEIMDLQNEVK
jgi:uncharacterized metal-binding protein